AARPLVRVPRRTRAELGDGGVVTLDEAVEAPLLLQDRRLRLPVRAPGDAVDGVERAHHRVGTGVDGGLERREVDVVEARLRHIRGVVFAAALRLPVGGEVLRARDDLVGPRVVAPLRGLYARGREHGAQIRILAGALGDPAPAWLVRHVDHRAVDLLDAD